MGYYGSLCATTGHDGPLWATMGHYYGSLCATTGHNGPLWATMGHYGPRHNILAVMAEDKTQSTSHRGEHGLKRLLPTTLDLGPIKGQASSGRSVTGVETRGRETFSVLGCAGVATADQRL